MDHRDKVFQTKRRRRRKQADSLVDERAIERRGKSKEKQRRVREKGQLLKKADGVQLQNDRGTTVGNRKGKTREASTGKKRRRIDKSRKKVRGPPLCVCFRYENEETFSRVSVGTKLSMTL